MSIVMKGANVIFKQDHPVPVVTRVEVIASAVGESLQHALGEEEWKPARAATLRVAETQVVTSPNGCTYSVEDVVITFVRTIEHDGSPTSYLTITSLCRIPQDTLVEDSELTIRVLLRSRHEGVIYEWKPSRIEIPASTSEVRYSAGTSVSPDICELLFDALVEVRAQQAVAENPGAQSK